MSTSDNEEKKKHTLKENQHTQANIDEALTKANKSRRERFIQRCQEASLVRKIVATILVLVIIFLVVGGITGYIYVRDGLAPADTSDETVKSVEIPLGSSPSQIANVLEEEGIVNNALIYRFYVKFNNAADFQAGEYQLSPSMTLAQVTEKLQTGNIMQEAVINVTIPEGKSIDEIATLYEKNAGVDADEFIEKMQDEDYIRQLIQTYPSILSEDILDSEIRYPLEGYLFAATYPFYTEDPSIDNIIKTMLEKTEQVVLMYQSQINEMEDFSMHEVITLASLVEKEARTEEERKKIAGVFYNRLEKDMRLETDPTVLYALGTHKDRVLFEDLEVESPYNTYRIDGLPVGPISSFGESSLQAVIEPEVTDFLFFVADPDGEIYYAETFERHKELAKEHLDRDL
ncbi:endolytic transglycosylase MltG [Paraliobacillus sediminis]|uniref:endolytic transglycosylase MltG n=1 Tax=Paraliobacillus sediminis TaxID=1885916 RepID=UPI000E3DC505|nr:endolytic transglycosylase MltG [Paraliobacillus sediminis]